MSATVAGTNPDPAASYTTTTDSTRELAGTGNMWLLRAWSACERFLQRLDTCRRADIPASTLPRRDTRVHPTSERRSSSPLLEPARMVCSGLGTVLLAHTAGLRRPSVERIVLCPVPRGWGLRRSALAKPVRGLVATPARGRPTGHKSPAAVLALRPPPEHSAPGLARRTREGRRTSAGERPYHVARLAAASPHRANIPGLRYGRSYPTGRCYAVATGAGNGGVT